MKNYRTINIIATIIGLIGISFQLYNDAYTEGGNSYGTYIVIAALLISAAVQILENKQKPKEE